MFNNSSTTPSSSVVQPEVLQVHDINLPWAILMDPTRHATALHRMWAADYGNKLT
jgi:hypothetical protein